MVGSTFPVDDITYFSVPDFALQRSIEMAGTMSLSELEDRIAIARDNIRQLIEQAAAISGGENEARTSDRIEQQTEAMEALVRERDELLKH
jgi:hypothetical protein